MSASLSTTQGLNAAPARTSSQYAATPGPWVALLWKDWRQLQPATFAIMAGMLGTQLIVMLGSLLFLPSSSWRSMTEGLVTIAMISPALLAIASGGMLIGHERQTGTWNWSSSLPVHWSLALISKLAVSFTAILLTLALLSAMPILSAIFFAELPKDSWVVGYYASVFSLLLALDTVVFFLLAALIFRDALNGLLIGAVWVLVIQVLVVAVPLQIASYYGRPSDRVSDWLLAVEMMTVLLGGIVALVAAFRWRWGRGQNAKLTWLPQSVTSTASEAYAPARVGQAPSQRRMLFSLGLQNSLGKRLAILGLLVLGLLMGAAYDPAPFVACGIAACALFGVTAFEGDQTHHRYAFLADRGVSPRELTHSRLVVPVLLSVLLSIVALCWFWWLEENLSAAWWVIPALAGILLAAVLCGSLASLSFDKTAISTVVALVTCIVAGIVYGMATTVVHWLDPNPYWFATYSFSIFLIVSIPALIWTIYRRVPVWLIQARPKLAGRYLGLVSLLIFAPVLVVANLGFLMLPKVPWQGLQPEQFVRQPVSMPQFSDAIDLLPGTLMSPAPTGALAGYVNEEYEELRNKLSIDGQLSKEFIAASESSLATLEQTIDSSRTLNDAAYSSRRLNELLLSTAAVTVLYAEAGEMDLARQSLQLHGQLWSMAVEQLAPDTIQSRIAAARLLLHQWESKQLSQLGPPDEMRSWLLPDLSGSRDQYRELVRARASYDLAVSQSKELSATPKGWPILYSRGLPQFYPPMQRRVERSIAMVLAAALKTIDEGSYRPLSSAGNLYLHEYLLRNQLQAVRSELESKLSRTANEADNRSPTDEADASQTVTD